MGFFLVSFLFALSAAYGLVFWAYRAENDRSARVGLYLVYGFPGILLFVAGLAFSMYGKDFGPTLLFVGLGITLPLVKSFRVAISRFTPINPTSPVDMSGLCVFLGILGLLFAVTLNASEPDAVSGAVDYGQLIVQMLAWVGLSYVVVGTGLRRKFSEANARLGLTRPTVWTIVASVGFVLVALLVNVLGGVLTTVFQPDTSDQIQQGLKELTGNVQSPVGALLLGASAGVGEELFFRGALQPKFGIVLTSLCFALLHTNYGLSFVTLGVLGMGFVFGFMRQRYGTIAPIITHALMNVIAVLIQTYS